MRKGTRLLTDLRQPAFLWYSHCATNVKDIARQERRYGQSSRLFPRAVNKVTPYFTRRQRKRPKKRTSLLHFLPSTSMRMYWVSSSDLCFHLWPKNHQTTCDFPRIGFLSVLQQTNKILRTLCWGFCVSSSSLATHPFPPVSGSSPCPAPSFSAFIHLPLYPQVSACVFAPAN